MIFRSGLRGKISDSWDWEASFGYGQYKQDQWRRNEINGVNLTQALDAGKVRVLASGAPPNTPGFFYLVASDAALADPQVQIVWLATPHSTHRKLAEQVAAAGKPLICCAPVLRRKSGRYPIRRRSIRICWRCVARVKCALLGRCWKPLP